MGMKKLLKRYSNLFRQYLFGRILHQKKRKKTRRNKMEAKEKKAKKPKKQPKNPNPTRKTRKKTPKAKMRTTQTRRSTFHTRKWITPGGLRSASTRYTSRWRRWCSQCPSQGQN